MIMKNSIVIQSNAAQQNAHFTRGTRGKFCYNFVVGALQAMESPGSTPGK